MRKPTFRATFEMLPGEILIDSFAGGGGASEAIEQAFQRPVDIAINHDPEAIALHKANHPETKHYIENIWEVDPKEACGGRRVGLAWFSPDCRHFSRARGRAPTSPGVRCLPWVVIRWAKAVRPRIIVMENVEELEDWGPIDDDGYPIKEKAGTTFRAFVAKLVSYGYAVEWRSLVAADFGAPTIRRRLFLVARCDGQPIVWPEPTHGDGRSESWRTAAEIIDWSVPAPSIFERPRPYKDPTLRRIAKGVVKFVIQAKRPFIVPMTHQGDSRVHSIDEPLRTITGAHRGELSIVEPFIVRHGHYSYKTGAGIDPGCGAGTFRGQPLSQPISTICATNDKHLVAPIVTKHYGGVTGHEATRPLGTITARDHHALTASFLTKFYGTCNHGQSLESPMPTITGQGQHVAQVQAFLIKYYGAQSGQQQTLFDPLHTVTSKARFALVTVHGEPYVISDIGMRMLQPHELFAAQGFPPDYFIVIDYNGKPLTKEAQIRLVGNSVSPPPARRLVLSNVVGDQARAA